MKALLILLVFILPVRSFGQVLLFEETFDFYQDESFAGIVSPFMGTWTGNTGFGTDDCQITNLEANSAPNSIAIYGPNLGGQIDAMVNFPSDYTSGRFEYTMQCKISPGKGGYFNVQSSSANVGNAWMLQTFFAADSTGKLFAGGNNFSFNYVNGEWFEFKLDCDLDLDTAFVEIDGNLVGTGFKWSVEANGAGNGSNHALGGINLFSTSGDPVADCEYYIDDLLLVETTGMWAGIEDAYSNTSFSVYPNPSNGQMTINLLKSDMHPTEIVLTDLYGKELYKEIIIKNSSSSFPLQLEIPQGLYVLSVVFEGAVESQKIVID